MSGLFITLEGGEGAGKTTIANAVIDKLSTLGIETLYTREPGGIKIAEKIREVILDRDHTEMDCRTEALLYAAVPSSWPIPLLFNFHFLYSIYGHI